MCTSTQMSLTDHVGGNWSVVRAAQNISDEHFVAAFADPQIKHLDRQKRRGALPHSRLSTQTLTCVCLNLQHLKSQQGQFYKYHHSKLWQWRRKKNNKKIITIIDFSLYFLRSFPHKFVFPFLINSPLRIRPLIHFTVFLINVWFFSLINYKFIIFSLNFEFFSCNFEFFADKIINFLFSVNLWLYVLPCFVFCNIKTLPPFLKKIFIGTKYAIALIRSSLRN